jgi:hypothetical protein
LRRQIKFRNDSRQNPFESQLGIPRLLLFLFGEIPQLQRVFYFKNRHFPLFFFFLDQTGLRQIFQDLVTKPLLKAVFLAILPAGNGPFLSKVS